MPPPISVRLVPHDPDWAARATAEGERGVVHHMGSTSIPGIAAKPVLDLMPILWSLEAIDAERGVIEALGYE